MNLKSFVAGFLLCAAPIFAQTADPDVEALLAPARAECADYDAGVVSVDDRAVQRVDITGDGASELFVDERFITCSTVAGLRSGTGGWVLHVLAAGQAQDWQMLEWSVIGWQPDPGYPAQKVLLLAKHGSQCGMAGSSPCVEAVVWSVDDKAFVSTNRTEAE